MKLRALPVVLICCLPATAGAAQVGEDAPEQAPARSLEDLSFFLGSWTADMLGGVGDLHWTPPRFGSLQGVFRLARGGETVMTEYLLVLEEAGEVVLRFKHFNNDYTTWEEAEPLTFTLAETSATHALFLSSIEGQGIGHLLYRLREDGTLYVKVGGGDDPEAPGGLRINFTPVRE